MNGGCRQNYVRTLRNGNNSILHTQVSTYYVLKKNRISHAALLDNSDYNTAANQGYPFARKYNPLIKFEGPYSSLKDKYVKWFGSRLCRNCSMCCKKCDEAHTKCIDCDDGSNLYNGNCLSKESYT